MLFIKKKSQKTDNNAKNIEKKHFSTSRISFSFFFFEPGRSARGGNNLTKVSLDNYPWSQ
jgi:hypothetical protein